MAQGITVLEIGDGVASAYCGRLLAGAGAHVIKLEPPGGSALRTREPLLPGGESALFEDLAMYKRSIELPPGSAGESAIERLAASADVVIDEVDVAAGVDPAFAVAAFPKLSEGI